MIQNLIAEEVFKYLKEISFINKIKNHERICELFFHDEINEENDINKKNKILNLIKNDEWYHPTTKEFKHSLSQSKHPMMLSDYSESELSQMKLFKLKDYNIGFGLKDSNGKSNSEIVVVHNNEPDVKGIGDELMKAAIRNGGCFLDHFDSTKLSNLYSSMGFEEYKRDEYDPRYDSQGTFKSQYGPLDVVYRKHKNC